MLVKGSTGNYDLARWKQTTKLCGSAYGWTVLFQCCTCTTLQMYEIIVDIHHSVGTCMKAMYGKWITRIMVIIGAHCSRACGIYLNQWCVCIYVLWPISMTSLDGWNMIISYSNSTVVCLQWCNKQRVLMHRHQGWNVRHGLCHIYMIYLYIWVVYSFCLFCCLFIIVTWW